MSTINCIRLRRNNLCRLDLKTCRENCPLRKTKEEAEQTKTILGHDTDRGEKDA